MLILIHGLRMEQKWVEQSRRVYIAVYDIASSTQTWNAGSGRQNRAILLLMTASLFLKQAVQLFTNIYTLRVLIQLQTEPVLYLDF
jgi:hypothetical protein